MIKKTSIENLKHHIDLYQLISDYVTLDRSGSSWKGLSPFTQEKTPSFYVYPDRGFYYCFSTSQGGDAIKFLQVKESFTFVEAVEALADRFNFQLEYETMDGKPGKRQGGSMSKQLRLIHEQAAKYYESVFNGSGEAAQQIREYWVKGRGFTLEDAQKYRIGFAPDDSGTLYRLLMDQHFSENELEASGLFYERGQSRRSSLSARFRGRLMVPICDLSGKVIAFTARKTALTPNTGASSESKYVNSPTTDLFNKGTLLFGIHVARKAVSDSRPFVMVEGQLDAVRCWTEGFEETIATQGTAITEIQLSKLKNYCSKLIMCLDGDTAGTKAAHRVLPMALKVGFDIRFVRLDKGDDPDSLLMREGREAFQVLLDSAKPAVPFMVESFFEEGRMDGASLSRSAHQCFQMINQSNSQVVKTQMVEELANLAGIDIRSVREDFDKFQRKGGNPWQSAREEQKDSRSKGNGQKLRTSESDMLTLLIQNQQLRSKVRETDFSDLIDLSSVEGQLLQRIGAELMENPSWTPENDSDLICENDDEQNLIYQLLAETEKPDSPEDLFMVCLTSMQMRFDKNRLRLIERKLNKGSTYDDDQLTALLTEKVEIQKRIAERKE